MKSHSSCFVLNFRHTYYFTHTHPPTHRHMYKHIQTCAKNFDQRSMSKEESYLISKQKTTRAMCFSESLDRFFKLLKLFSYFYSASACYVVRTFALAFLTLLHYGSAEEKTYNCQTLGEL